VEFSSAAIQMTSFDLGDVCSMTYEWVMPTLVNIANKIQNLVPLLRLAMADQLVDICHSAS
jgi:hypothetical protein